jgi:hypothetical protein
MQYRAPSLFQWGFWLSTRFMGWLFLGCLGCVVMSIVIIMLHGDQAGFAGLQVLTQQDYRYLEQTTQPETLSMINGWLQHIPGTWSLPKVSLPMISANVGQRFCASITPLINGALLGVKLLIIRLYLILRWCPLFLIVGFAGVVDGLTQRSIRRACAGRESALIYHNAKPLIMLSLLLGICLDLVLPISIAHAEWLWIMAALLLGIAVQITAKSFKKYL